MALPGFAVASLFELKSIPAQQRIEGLTRLVLTGLSSAYWYVFKSNSTLTPDDDFIVLPDDSPSEGRFIKVGSVPQSNTGGEYVDLFSDQEISGSKHFENQVKSKHSFLVTESGFDSKPILAVYDEGNVTYTPDGYPQFSFFIDNYGALAWTNPGSQSYPDMSLFREGTKVLGLYGTFRIYDNLFVHGSASIDGEIESNLNLQLNKEIKLNGGSLVFRRDSQAYPTCRIKSSGDIEWGDGLNQPDTHLYRLEPGYLETGKISVSSLQFSNLQPAPNSSSDTGTTGEVRFTTNAIYVCIAPNSWKRTLLSDF